MKLTAPSVICRLLTLSKVEMMSVAVQVVVLRDGHIVCTQKVDYEPQCAAINPAQNEVVVGGGNQVRY